MLLLQTHAKMQNSLFASNHYNIYGGNAKMCLDSVLVVHDVIRLEAADQRDANSASEVVQDQRQQIQFCWW